MKPRCVVMRIHGSVPVTGLHPRATWSRRTGIVSSEADAIAALRRACQVYHEQITERVTLSCGIALLCPEYPTLHEGNHFREVILPPDGSLESAWREVQGCYAEHGLTCYEWVPAAGTPIEPVEAFLAGKGFTTRRNLCMVWRHDVEHPVSEGVRILPARAMRRACREVALNDARVAPDRRGMVADAANDRLDDPQYDRFVAMVDGRPGASGALHQVGDIGRIHDVIELAFCRDRGVGTALVSHLLALSRRLAMRITVAEVDEADADGRALYTACGFEPAGALARFIAPIY